MSILNWLFPKTGASKTASLPFGNLTADCVTLASTSASTEPMVDTKQQRHARRELLYEVVRSAMLRSEVLAAHYKFKVLSLDPQGREFLIMIDLLGEPVLACDRWLQVEQLMSQMAAQRHDLQVKAVYWRWLTSAPGAVAQAPSAHGFAPINPEEMLAFKKDRADSTLDHNLYPAEPGFEDTQLLEIDAIVLPGKVQ